MVGGGCGILLAPRVAGGDGMLDWGNDGEGMLYGDNGAGGIRGENLVRRMIGFALLYVLFGCGVDGSGGIFDGRRGGGAGIWFGGNVARGIRGEKLVCRTGLKVGDMSGVGGGRNSM